MASAASATTSSGLRKFWSVQLLERGAKLFARGSEILQEFNLAIEVDEESLVLLRAQCAVEKGVTRAALLIEDTPLAEACVNKQPEGEGKIALAREILDGLRAAIFFDREVGLIQGCDDLAVLVTDGCVDRHELHFGGDFGR